MRHLLSLLDLNSDEIEEIFEIAGSLKQQYENGVREPLLQGRVMGLLFEKPSLRTRVSFEAGMTHLGGTSQFLGQDVGWGKRESVKDFAEVLSQYVDVIVCRARQHNNLETLASFSQCPVINGLTELAHPCQALADLFTLRELYGDLTNRCVVYIGDGNNVARSLALACAKLNVGFALSAPREYQVNGDFWSQVKAVRPHFEPRFSENPVEVLQDACCVYTDVWASMGQEAERKKRREDFAAYQVNEALMAHAPGDACFMHCLPARRGEEVTNEVIDSPQSVVVRQAANRMHVQKGILVWYLKQKT